MGEIEMEIMFCFGAFPEPTCSGFSVLGTLMKSYEACWETMDIYAGQTLKMSNGKFLTVQKKMLNLHVCTKIQGEKAQ